MPQPNLLNLGCGRHFHWQWTNVDFVSHTPEVRQCDLRQGLEEEDDFYDVVYHSHVLEHFSPNQGKAFLAECFRVLKPGGTLRIAVPDLEQIARLYLKYLEQGWSGQEQALPRYDWMKLELLDQMTRHQSGGAMGPFMVDAAGDVAQFIDQRLGRELEYAKQGPTDSNESDSPDSAQTSQAGAKESWRNWVARKTICWLLGKSTWERFQIGQFRDSGEVHRWMYDRLSLRRLCEELGFTDFVVRSAWESYFPGFASYQLDGAQGKVRKPDSLFVECRKPAISKPVRQAA